MLHLIGIGYKIKDLTIEQKEIIENSSQVFLEYYTSFYEDSFDELEKFLNKKITICDRNLIESEIEEKILKPSKDNDIALLVLGDPLIATTHTDLLLRAKEMNIKTKVYNNISVGNLITKTGLQFYKFGKITSIPFFNQKFMPRTPYLTFLDNMRMGAHSLFLLDLNPSDDFAYKGKERYLKARDALSFLMTIPQIMLKEEEIEEKDTMWLDIETPVVVCSRLGFKDETIIYGTCGEVIEYDKTHDLKEPLCVIVPGDMHSMEEEFLEQFRI